MISVSNAVMLSAQLDKKLMPFSLDRMARETGFVQRKERKITPRAFLMGLFIMILTGQHSLSSCATILGLLRNLCISKQAVDKRINQGLIDFLHRLLGHCLAHGISQSTSLLKGHLTTRFNRVLVQDSTQIQLTPTLAEQFPGSRNQTHKQFSMLKIQAVYDLLTETFQYFDFSGFNKNDQIASKDILAVLKPGDLLIRDLGYFVLSVLKKITLLHACFLSRYRYGTLILDKNDQIPLDLVKLLKKNDVLDKDVLLGKNEKIPVRLIAIPVSESIAAERRRKARGNRDRRMNPSKKHLFLMGWNIFVTNVSRNTLSVKHIALLYRLRWRIEIIFKSWKSHFHLRNVPKACYERVLTYIYSILIFVTLFQTHVYHSLYQQSINSGQQLSLFKISKFFKEQIWAVVLLFLQPESIEKQLFYHCSYEKRKNKVNYLQTAMALS